MKTTSTEPMDASKQFCPNEMRSARGKIGAGNIRIHSYRPQRYRCHESFMDGGGGERAPRSGPGRLFIATRSPVLSIRASAPRAH